MLMLQKHGVGNEIASFPALLSHFWICPSKMEHDKKLKEPPWGLLEIVIDWLITILREAKRYLNQSRYEENQRTVREYIKQQREQRQGRRVVMREIDEDFIREIAEGSIAEMKVGCYCGDPSCTPTGSPCKKCEKPCTYQPTVSGRPLYRCEWALLQHGPHGAEERHYVHQKMQWYWTCSQCGMEPMYQHWLKRPKLKADAICSVDKS